MILHCVFCNFLSDAGHDQQQSVLDRLASFSRTLDGVLSFETGPNRDFENKSADYNAGFIIKFRDRAALNAYAVHPTHQSLGAELCDLCTGGADGIIVYDLEV